MKRLLLLLLMITYGAIAMAQQPDRTQTRDAVLQAMSERFGTTITEASFTYRFWYFGNYGYVTQFGCIGAPASPPTSGTWQRFEYTYQGTEFVYLISDNLQSIILCNESAMPTADATAVPTTVPAVTATPASPAEPNTATATFSPLPTSSATGSGTSGGGIACDLPARLSVGGRAEVTPGEPNWLHIDPARSSTKIGEIPGGAQFDVLAGGECDPETGMIYWYVAYQGQAGWTSEGLNGQYWLVPVVARASLSATALNDATVPAWFGAYTDNTTLRVATHPGDSFVALGADDGSLWVWNTASSENIYAVSVLSAITALTFTDAGDELIVGTSDGAVYVIDYIGNAVLATIATRDSAPVTAIAARGNVIAIADETARLALADTATYTVAGTYNLAQPAYDLTFNADNTLITVRDREDYLITVLQLP